jgi:hypothetical protein
VVRVFGDRELGSVFFWVLLIAFLPFDGPFDVRGGDFFFFRESMSQNRHVFAVEKVKDAVVNSPFLPTEFIDAVA